MSLLEKFDRIDAFVNAFITIDVDRSLIDAAKVLSRACREHCHGRCDICDEKIEYAWLERKRWRRVQQVRRTLRFDVVYGAMTGAWVR